jgi:hypothetical protein
MTAILEKPLGVTVNPPRSEHKAHVEDAREIEEVKIKAANITAPPIWVHFP